MFANRNHWDKPQEPKQPAESAKKLDISRVAPKKRETVAKPKLVLWRK